MTDEVCQAHGFVQGVRLEVHLLGDLFRGLSFVQLALHLTNHVRFKHGWPPRMPFLIEPAWSFFPIALYGSFDADGRHPKGADDFDLLGGAVDTELGRDHPEGGQVFRVVDEDRQDAMKVGDLSLTPDERQSVVDACGAVGEQG